jgi:hypothetical protein
LDRAGSPNSTTGTFDGEAARRDLGYEPEWTLEQGSPTMPNGSRLTRRDVGLRGSGGRLITGVPILHLGLVLALTILTILGLALTSYEIRHARLSPAKTQIIPIQIAHLRIPHLQVLRIAA